MLPEAFELRPLFQQYKLPTACQWMKGTPELGVRIFRSPGLTGYSVQATFASSRPKEEIRMYQLNVYSLFFLQCCYQVNKDSRFFHNHLFVRQISQLPATHSAIVTKIKSKKKEIAHRTTASEISAI